MENEVRIAYFPVGVCSVRMDIVLSGDIVEEVRITGGCRGNSQGVCALVRGMDVHKAIERLEGIDCAGKGTSCPDQLARGLRKAVTEKG